MGHYLMKLTMYHVFKASFADEHSSHDVFWHAYQHTSFLASGWFWRGHLIVKTQLKTSTKRVYVGQKWPNHGTRVEWEYKSSISWTYMCSGDFKRQALSPFLCISSQLFSTNCCLGKPNNAARGVIWTAHGNSIIIGGNASARATAEPSTIKWFHLVPPEYYLTATERENSADQNMFFDILMIIIIWYTPITHGPHKCTQICWLVVSKHSLSLVFWLC